MWGKTQNKTRILPKSESVGSRGGGPFSDLSTTGRENPWGLHEETTMNDETTENHETTTTTTTPSGKGPHLGGSYLKADGLLKRPTTVAIDGRKGTVPNHPGGPRIVEKEFGRQVEIPISIEGQDFVVAIPADKGDGAALFQAFGDDMAKWVGKRITVQESNVLRRIRITVPETTPAR